MARQRKLPLGLWKRGKVYYARFRANGRVIAKKIGPDLQAAKEVLAHLKARASRADFGLVDNDYSWQELKAWFLRWAQRNVKEHAKYKHELGLFEKYLPVRSIRQIDSDYVAGYQEWRLANAQRKELTTVTARTINKEVGTLKNMLNRAVKEKKIGSNPIEHLKPLPHNPTKERRALSQTEVEALFACSSPREREIWRTFMVTGLRKSELVKLELPHVDFENRCLTVIQANAKGKKSREIPLDDECLEMFVRLRREALARQRTPETIDKHFSKKHYFVTKDGHPLVNNLLRIFYAACKRAGIEDARPGGAVDIHSLRVTFTTLCLAGGAGPKDVQQLLGHSTLALTMKVYARVTDQSKRAAIGAIPFAKVTTPKHIAGTIEPSKASAV